MRVDAEQQQAITRGKIPVPNVSPESFKLLDNLDKLTTLDTAAYEPWMPKKWRQPNGFLGDTKRQGAVLRGFGEAGRGLDTIQFQYNNGTEMYVGDLLSKTRHDSTEPTEKGFEKMGPAQVGDWLHKQGLQSEDLDADSTTPKDAKKMKLIKIYEDKVMGMWDDSFKAAKHYGVAGPEEKNYRIPKMYKFKPEDLSNVTLDHVKETLAHFGIQVTNADEVAHYLNNPDEAVQGQIAINKSWQPLAGDVSYDTRFNGRAVPLTDVQKLELQRQMHQYAAQLDHTLQTGRKGGATGERLNLKETIRRGAYMRGRRIVEAATMGPNLEKVHGLISAIDGNPSFPTDNQIRAQQIMDNVRGRTYNPLSKGVSRSFEFARGHLLQSFVKHTWQAGMLLGHSPYDTTKGLLYTMAHVMRDGRTARDLGVSVPYTMWEVAQKDVLEGHPDEGVFPAITRTFGKVGQFPLHVTINAIRRLGMNTGFVQFDRLFPKALAGNKTALKLLSEMTRAKLDPESLAAMDKDTLRNQYAHAVANFAGNQFSPGNTPAFANTNVGRFLMMFQKFAWINTGNTFEMMFNRGVPLSVRARRMIALAIISPKVAHFAAWYYHKTKADTIDGYEMLKAVQYAQTKPGLRAYINEEIQSALMNHMFGHLSGILQGFITHDHEVMANAAEMAFPAASGPLDFLFAGDDAIAYSQDRNPKDKEAALNHFFSGMFGQFGTSINREGGRQKIFRMPKQNLIVGHDWQSQSVSEVTKGRFLHHNLSPMPPSGYLWFLRRW